MNWSFLFGKLTLDALPFYSPIAAGGAAVIVLGGLAVLAVVAGIGRRGEAGAAGAAECGQSPDGIASAAIRGSSCAGAK